MVECMQIIFAHAAKSPYNTETTATTSTDKTEFSFVILLISQYRNIRITSQKRILLLLPMSACNIITASV